MEGGHAASGCLDETAVLAYLGAGIATEAIDVHLADCAACRLLVLLAAPRSEPTTEPDEATTGNVPTRPDAAFLRGSQRPTATLAEGDRLGRYEIIAPLGSGGMAAVYAARDPKLERRVAIKLLHGPGTPGAGEQLVREGRAIARLAHPNVLTVHDIGEEAGQWYVAMELVEAGTLDHWLGAAPRTSREILAMFVAAGRGLEAAHEAGLVHRDFKPANVLVGSDGRPRVSDFGIALVDDGQGAAGGSPGTPAYMAPEQIDGRPVDARADQFSFAVALFEALDGRRPFPGITLGSIRTSMRSGPAKSRALGSMRVNTALRRALSESPDDRFPSMTDLLRRITPSRVRAAHIIALGCALGIGGVGAKLLIADSQRPDPCKGLDRDLSGVWDHGRADLLTAAFVKTGLADAVDTAHSVRRGLDRYAATWIAARVDSCEAAQVRRDQTLAQQELRTVCLDERLAELRATTDVLIDPDREVVTGAHALLAALTPPDACGNLATLAERLPVTSPEQLAHVRAVRAQLAHVNVQIAAGQFGPAELQLASLRPLVDATSYRPLQAEAAFLVGTLADKQGRLAQADRDLRDAVLAAEAGRDNRTAAAAWLQLVHVRARGRGDATGAADALAHATATVERLGPNVDAQADLAYARAIVHRLTGQYGDARAAFDDALRLLQRSRVDRTVQRTRVQLDLAGVLGSLGELATAQTTADTAITQLRSTIGNLHPDLGGALVVAAATALWRRDVVVATANLDEAERILRATTGDEHPRFAQLLMVRGQQLAADGEPAAALTLLQRALELLQARYGKEHALVATLHRMIASTAIDTGDLALARSELAIATALFDEVMETDSFEAVQTRMLGPWLAFTEGDPAQAEALARSNVLDCTGRLGTAHLLTAEANRTLGFILHERGKLPDAVATYHEAIAIMQRSGGGELRTTAQYNVELGEILLAMKRFEDAGTALASAVAIEEANRSERTPNARSARYLLAEAQRGANHWADSVRLLESLVTDLAHDEADPMLHRARMWLGIDLARIGGDPARARALVTAARTALATLDPDAARTAAAWLRALNQGSRPATAP